MDRADVREGLLSRLIQGVLQAGGLQTHCTDLCQALCHLISILWWDSWGDMELVHLRL